MDYEELAEWANLAAITEADTVAEILEEGGDEEEVAAGRQRARTYGAIATTLRKQAAWIADLKAWIANPPSHKFWGAGEADCPAEIKAGNGELHTLRCKVCGLDSPRDNRCGDAPGVAGGALK